MDGNKNSVIRMVLILMAVASVVLAAIQVVKLTGNKEEDIPQADLSGYGSEEDSSVNIDDGVIVEDDGTLEMDSIPNGLLTSGSDAVSGADAVSSDTDAE